MRVVTMIIAFAAQAHAAELAYVGDTQDSMDNYDVELMNKLLQGSPMMSADLDEAVLGKPGHLAPPPRMSAASASRAAALPFVGHQAQTRAAATPSHMQVNTQPLAANLASPASMLGEPVSSWKPQPSTRSVGMRSMSVQASGSAATPVSVGLVGLGGVGKELVSQIEGQKAYLIAKGLDISIVAVAGSSSMFLGGSAVADATAKSGGVPTDLAKLGEFVKGQPGKPIIVDCSAADEPGEFYAQWLKAGIFVATPNKKLGSGPLDRYKATFAAASEGGTAFFYEATVGAGLPIISTLQDLLDAGDEVDKIEGILSGTLSYLFNQEPGKAFSDLVQQAADNGFTEPDPRDDLSGTDVQRKALILARECGLQLEMKDIPVESLVPAPLESWEPTAEEKASGLANAFIAKLKDYDADMSKRMAEADAKNEVLRYVATIDIKNKKATVGLGSFPKTSPFAATQYADNIVSFSTKWYTPRPLVVQGPGAGGPVTAGGVFADVLKAARRC